MLIDRLLSIGKAFKMLGIVFCNHCGNPVKMEDALDSHYQGFYYCSMNCFHDGGM